MFSPALLFDLESLHSLSSIPVLTSILFSAPWKVKRARHEVEIKQHGEGRTRIESLKRGASGCSGGAKFKSV